MLDHGYFKDYYRLISVDLSKQKALDPAPRAVKQIVFQGKAGQKIRLYTILKKKRKKILQLYRDTAKVLWIIQMIEYNKRNIRFTTK